jgi:lathosterol oxidase
MEPLILWLRDAPLWQAALVLLAENAFIVLFCLAVGELLIRAGRERRVAEEPLPLKRLEVVVVITTTLLNTVITIVGLMLWKAGHVRFRTDFGLWAWLDILALLLIMDFAMYGLHRLAHHPLFFRFLHKLHHEFDRPRPLTLFLLHPLEDIAFGGLWLAVILVYPASWFGMSVYLVLNVLFGTIGHLGVEPFPEWWSRTPVLRYVAGSTFHARHHQDLESNFGFYTLFWDRLFGTLRPDYFATFGKPFEGPRAPVSEIASAR